MNPRSVPPLKLPKSPLIFVLAQVKISPVLGMESKIPALQEAYRKQGFPRLAERKIETTVRGSEGQTVQKETRRQWEFINKDKRASVLVDSEGLNYQVTKYDVFESFMASIESVLQVFSDTVEPTLVLRTGLRYVDLVIPAEGKDIHVYFNASLRGFKIHDTDQRKAFFTESVCQTGSDSTFVHRYVEADAGFGFPPDLLPMQLEFPRNPRMTSPFGLLDMDHFSMNEADFSTEEVVSRFFDLHEHQTVAFEASVTAEALEEWKQS